MARKKQTSKRRDLRLVGRNTLNSKPTNLSWSSTKTKVSTKNRRNNTSIKTNKLLQSGADIAKQTSMGLLGLFVDLMKRSRIVLVVVILLALLLFGWLFDSVANFGKAYSGVSVGGVDVGGLNASQIEEKIGLEYSSRISNAGITIYANEAAARTGLPLQDIANEQEDQSVIDQDTEEEAKKEVWVTDSAALQAYIDYNTLIDEALSQGRQGPQDRLALFFEKRNVEIPINYNEAIVEALAQQIDESIGEPLQNFDVEVSYGIASVTEGKDGNMVNRDTFKQHLSELFLSEDTENKSFIAEVEYTPVNIDRNTAQNTANNINAAIENGILFVCEDKRWEADAATVGDWIQTTISKDEKGNYSLSPSISFQTARASVLSHIQPTFDSGDGHIRFTKSHDDIRVSVTSAGIFPLVGDAIEEINFALFSNQKRPADLSTGEGRPLQVDLETSTIPESMTLQEALSYGVITPISEFTTEYTTGAVERNANIHLAADLLNNSIIKADGGEWSFNDTAGECNEEKGFQAAKAISRDEVIDEIGGGICQVATTVFNAVYESGYPIMERHNHSIYIASYPQGRDATISWPAPDFRWKNDSKSDLLLQMTYTDSSVTATLYGEDLGYTVETEEGKWIEGQEYSTVYETDDTLYPGYEYVKTYGENGHSYSVTRIVKNQDDNVIRTDVFASVYTPQNMVIVRGPGGDEWSSTNYESPDSGYSYSEPSPYIEPDSGYTEQTYTDYSYQDTYAETYFDQNQDFYSDYSLDTSVSYTQENAY